jgi:hypothetical protein
MVLENLMNGIPFRCQLEQRASTRFQKHKKEKVRAYI